MRISKMGKAAMLTALMALFAMPPSPVLAQQIYKGQVSVAPNAVRIAGDEVFTINAAAGGFSPEERAIIVERNISNAILETADVSPDCVQIVAINGLPVIRIGGKHVVTIDSRSAQLAGTSMPVLAQTWADNMRHVLSDKAKITAYISNFGGDYIGIPSPNRFVQYEAARLNHAADVPLGVNPEVQTSLSFERLGMSNMLARDYKTAAESFKRSLEMDKGNAQAHFGLGSAYLKLGQVDAAVNELQMARWLEPDSAMTHIALGEAFETRGHDVDAVAQFKEAELLQPDNPTPYLMVADLREQRNDIGKSVAELTAASQQIPGSAYIALRRKDQLLWRLDRPY